MRHLRGTFANAVALLAVASAATDTDTARAASSSAVPSATVPLSTGAVALDFTIAIDKFIFFRIGDGAWPTPGGTTSMVSFALAPTIPGGPTTPTAGNNKPVNWNGAAPTFSVTPSGNALPVEVRSNAGQVTLRATATTPLSNGTSTIPMSEIAIASSDTNLPAPAIPNTGTGTPVNVAGTALGNLVTVRSATWTFSYANLASRRAGTYLGMVTFTASSP
ncbi:hypothetical protein QTI51_34315 [Variovorax sp. J22G73]|uniref:hypothetical protein n=1 Tax=unclassified Variovorax TaxID=663243 RepID=UPI000D5FCAC5|nr:MULTISPECIES: hypothetical protein [unclassified Variovorax]MDM0009886.1 hypothetical protein [Variovorax sp. J22R203]MDM0102394.1 hypothetical protein [Variovorax sp. J22G73]